MRGFTLITVFTILINSSFASPTSGTVTLRTVATILSRDASEGTKRCMMEKLHLTDLNDPLADEEYRTADEHSKHILHQIGITVMLARIACDVEQNQDTVYSDVAKHLLEETMKEIAAVKSDAAACHTGSSSGSSSGEECKEKLSKVGEFASQKLIQITGSPQLTPEQMADLEKFRKSVINLSVSTANNNMGDASAVREHVAGYKKGIKDLINDALKYRINTYPSKVHIFH